MKKILSLQIELLKEITKYEKIVQVRDHLIDWERVHISSCAKLGYLLAEKRGVDPVLASCACSVHDYGRIITGKQDGHAEAGYLPVRKFLDSTDLFNEEEIDQITTAVRNHSKKGEVGSPLEEIVKDADVLDFYQYGYEMSRQDQKARLDALLKGERFL